LSNAKSRKKTLIFRRQKLSSADDIVSQATAIATFPASAKPVTETQGTSAQETHPPPASGSSTTGAGDAATRDDVVESSPADDLPPHQAGDGGQTLAPKITDPGDVEEGELSGSDHDWIFV